MRLIEETSNATIELAVIPFNEIEVKYSKDNEIYAAIPYKLESPRLKALHRKLFFPLKVCYLDFIKEELYISEIFLKKLVDKRKEEDLGSGKSTLRVPKHSTVTAPKDRWDNKGKGKSRGTLKRGISV